MYFVMAHCVLVLNLRIGTSANSSFPFESMLVRLISCKASIYESPKLRFGMKPDID
jgi:hypothetical protein